jgi:hypothetical protein
MKRDIAKGEKVMLMEDSSTSPSENENVAPSCIISNRKMKTTNAYDKLMSTERPIGIFFYGLFLILSPLVFRYAMYSAMTVTVTEHKFTPLGNSTLSITTDWSCSKCDGYNGHTLSSVVVTSQNITDPQMTKGFPSVAIFASQDFIHW